jgi:DNA-binding response OmpR family regulator
VSRILVVDDEPGLARALAINLRAHGYAVEAVGTGRDALSAASDEPPDLVVLDLGLPDLDGFELCRRLRGSADVPILILTARDEEADRVIGLELGADDYVTKPFSPRELVARVRAVLRRAEPLPADAELLELGELRIDFRSRTVTIAGSPVELRTLEFELLAELSRNAGHVVTRDRLLDRVWGVPFAGGTRTVDVHVAQLRKKLGRPGLIQTVRGVGYRLLEA